MYRVFLNANPKDPRKEEWIDAVTIRPSWVGAHWEFMDADGFVVHRMKQDRMDRFEQAADRRQPRHVKLLQPNDAILNERFTDNGTPA